MRIKCAYTPLTTKQLADLLGMSEEQMLRDCNDLDLIDTARWLIDNKADLADAGEVPLGFFHAAKIVARSLVITDSST